MAQQLYASAPIALAIALALGPGRPVHATPPTQRSAVVEFDTRLLGPEVGARVEAQLTEQLGPALVDSGYALASDSATVDGTLRIRVIRFDADAQDYEVEVLLVVPDAEPIGGTILCNACGESRLVRRILEAAPDLLETKDEPPTIERIEPVPVADPLPAPEPETVRRIGAMGITGIGLGVVGLAVGSVGVERLIKNEIVQIGDEAITTWDFRPAGAVATSLGAAALITGVVLVAVDVQRRRKRNLRHAIHVTPTYVGFQIEHRF